MKKPNFFVLGAPKCGTTSISTWLSRHPQVYFCPVKEPNYFNTDFHVPDRISEEGYQHLFSGVTDMHRAVGEGTTGYLRSQVAVREILAWCGAPKFIVCIRNPIDMLVSLHRQRLREGRETVRSVEEAWRLEPDRREGRHLPPFCEDRKNLLYGDICRIGEQLDRLCGIVEARQVHIVVLDDMRNNPEIEYARILEFLELDPYMPDRFDVRNPSRSLPFPLPYLMRGMRRVKRKMGLSGRWGVQTAVENLIGRSSGRETLSAAFLGELRDNFEPDIRKLERRLSRSFAHWYAENAVEFGEQESGA